MKQMKEYFGKLTTLKKIEAIIASIATLFLMIAAPIYAWFSYTNRVETLTKIQEPSNLNLCAGDGDPLEYFELSNIDLEEIQETGKPKCYVFGVITDNAKTFYDIQLAHTTNIPFTYTLYRANVSDSTDPNAVVYEGVSGDVYYTRTIKEGKTTAEALDLVALNADTAKTSQYGRTLAKADDKYYKMTYDDSTDEPEIYAIPIYSKVKGLETIDPLNDFYILEVNWDEGAAAEGFDKWNAAINNKETDVIYITASRSTV